MKVLLLAGGVSNEREVSLTSGQSIYESLNKQGHKVFAIDPASGRSLLGSDGKFIDSGLSESSGPTTGGKLDARSLTTSLTSPGFADIDVVFIALHGGIGENGTIQCLLDIAGKKYTGSNMTASAIAMNKAISKRLFAGADIPTPEWELIRISSNQEVADAVATIVEKFELPVVVKPNNSGSTVGVSLVKTEAQLKPALKKAIETGSEVLIERYIPGRELTVAMLNGRPMPVVEICPQNEMYDYEAKYTEGKSEYIAPAKIESKISDCAQQYATKAYEVIGAAGLARVDFMLGEDDVLYCLELNTLPGMTSLSLAPMAAACEGIDFDNLVSILLASASDTVRYGQ